MKPRLLLLGWVAACGLALAPGCSNPPTPVTCPDIPTGGCPQDNGADVCADPTCVAVYDCTHSGKWALDHTCPPRHDAGVMDAAEEIAMDTGAPDVALDAPPGAYGGRGCSDLQMPDCSLGTALGCSGTADCCGCMDLYVCQNGGWNLWGSCADGGIVAHP